MQSKKWTSAYAQTNVMVLQSAAAPGIPNATHAINDDDATMSDLFDAGKTM